MTHHHYDWGRERGNSPFRKSVRVPSNSSEEPEILSTRFSSYMSGSDLDDAE